MRTFHCDSCGSLVFFESVSCVTCGHALGFLPDLLDLSAIEPNSDGTWKALSSGATRPYRSCANATEHSACNWLVPADDPSPFCLACRLNEVIPNLTIAGNRERWHRIEQAKRRLIYTLEKLALPTEPAPERQIPGLRFRFLGNTGAGTRVMTGHADGVITIDIAEADDAVREQHRVSLHEPFRTLLGHLRHEVAHYYWQRLVATGPYLESFRALFGDERTDYAAALQQHYRSGAPSDWSSRFVTAYASAHPWEDWAETTAHYFHIIDTIETAAGFGMTLRPRHPAAQTMTADPRKTVQAEGDFAALLAAWFPLTYALNELNRGVGLADLYPFVLSTPAIEKLRLVHEIITSSRKTSRPPSVALAAT